MRILFQVSSWSKGFAEDDRGANAARGVVEGRSERNLPKP